MAQYSGKQKLKFCECLGDDWWKVAAYLDIPSDTQRTFPQGNEPRRIWEWAEVRNQLHQLPDALRHIDREDIVLQVFEPPAPPKTPQQVTWKGSPYPGLCHFTEAQAPIFFGRARETRALLDKLSKNPFLAIVGASGSGKSSLIAAGVIPRLEEIAGGFQWECVRFTPGIFEDPFMALASRLDQRLVEHGQRDKDIAVKLRARGDLTEYADRILKGRPEGKLFLFIDQFEELFTRTKPEHHHQFLAMLEKATKIPQLCTVITLRADFYPHCLKHRSLETLLNDGMFSLAAPDKRALYVMITGPASLAGVSFDEGLPWRILEDTGDEPGALALMAFALAELYRACQPSTIMTDSAYDSFGGVRGAIAKRADTAYGELDQDTRTAFGNVFKELVEVDPECGVPTRKRAPSRRFIDSPAANALVNTFTQARLFVGSDAPGGEEVVEVAHEALLTNWPRLHEWIEARFDDFRLLRQVRLDAAEWERQGRPDANLWRHERLKPVHHMRERLQPELTDPEKAFIRSEADRLLENIDNPATTPQQRAIIGDRLADIGDHREGVGLNADGLPVLKWCEVPPGKITLEDNGGTFTVKEFAISRYPITWVQYRSFLEAQDGYRWKKWWKGLAGREQEPGNQYRTRDNHPAENVSWYDAMVFCRWLSHRVGYEIRLPTEWEWQQAATGGQSANHYPWGKDWYPEFANTFESGLSRTTAVGLYPQGQSSMGALDMSGNVWEWCLNESENPKKEMNSATENSRVLRGGSWLNHQLDALATSRFCARPDYRNNRLGFRVVRSSPISS
ncbi:nSTAND1 domain-containing NTPase [Candidatus Nitrospira neomarina]|uniref:SUMF1/EgtB/PvdO family nonheme iron enzyme n=1 Tax=Candidatus Nitrospira neomarina TaxID=3020899 RepID=A0AA96GLH8_9BACT|nr:SUMF1/EgtB/PvdO family nonheme iron enzyme [Candidatus Nitrospira neomarina]WNM60484.1 SUMF1/EgtB/PvdO family nonheme iron enzyme [Candidatus Nitrospira neomarina]